MGTDRFSGKHVNPELFGLDGCEPLSNGRVGQTIGLRIVLAADVGDGELQGAGQFLADPVEGIQAGAAAGVLTLHLPDHHFGIGENVQGLGFQF